MSQQSQTTEAGETVTFEGVLTNVTQIPVTVDITLFKNSLPAEWLDRLPLFIKLVQVEEFLHYAQYLEEPDDELHDELNYKIKCIEKGIPYMGFFDDIYSPEKPFSL